MPEQNVTEPTSTTTSSDQPTNPSTTTSSDPVLDSLYPQKNEIKAEAEAEKPEAEAEKPKDAEKPEGDKADPKEEKPEASEIEHVKIEFPEDMKVDADAAKKYEDFVNELRKPDADVAKIALEFAKDYTKSLEGSIKETLDGQLTTMVDKQISEWGETAKKDAEYGGVNFEKNMGVAKAAIKKLGGDALIQALDETGAGSHPEIIRLAYRIGKRMAEGEVFTDRGEGKSESRDILSQIYKKT